MFKNFPSGKIRQLLDVVKQVLHIHLAWLHKRKGKMDRARKRMDRALASTAEPEAFMLAFDGFLMVREDRVQLARARFSECLRIAKSEESADDDYVAKFCRLWLAIGDESVGFEEIKSAAEEQNAAWSKASRIVQIYLPRSPIDRLQEICGHRISQVQASWLLPSQELLISTKITSQASFFSTKTTFDL
jgi:hypothetical protein